MRSHQISGPCAYLEDNEIIWLHTSGLDVLAHRTQVLVDVFHHNLRHLSR